MDGKIEIPIDSTSLENFEDEAIQKIVNNTTVYVTNIIKEATLLESSRRKGVGKPLVREHDVQKALFLFEQNEVQDDKRKPWWKKVLHGVVPVLSILPGLIYPKHSNWSDVACLLIVIIVVLITVYLIED